MKVEELLNEKKRKYVVFITEIVFEVDDIDDQNNKQSFLNYMENLMNRSPIKMSVDVKSEGDKDIITFEMKFHVKTTTEERLDYYKRCRNLIGMWERTTLAIAKEKFEIPKGSVRVRSSGVEAYEADVKGNIKVEA